MTILVHNKEIVVTGLENSIAFSIPVPHSYIVVTIDPAPADSSVSVTCSSTGKDTAVYVTNNTTGKTKKYSLVYDSLNHRIADKLDELSRRTIRNPNNLSNEEYYRSLGRGRKKGKTKRW